MSYTLLKHKKVKTKKKHLCFSCLRAFPKDSYMINWAGIYFGDFNSGYTCVTCEEIINLYVKNNYIDSSVVDFGFVNEMVSKEITPEIILENLKKEQK